MTDTGADATTPYSDADVRSLLNWIALALQDRSAGDPVPDTMKVKGRIEWNGDERDRPVNLDRLDLRRFMRLWDGAVRAAKRGKSAGATYRQTTPAAQARRLAESKAGLSTLHSIAPPSRVRKWLSGEVTPNAANRRRIAEAHQAAADKVRQGARARDEAGRAQLIDALDQAIADRYQGAKVRFRSITRLSFE